MSARAGRPENLTTKDLRQAHLRKFFIAGALCLALGVLQGVVQVWPSSARRLGDAGYYGYLISPLAHARLNILGGVLLLLMGYVYAAAPALLGVRPGRRLVNLTFGLALSGALAHYLTLLGSGLSKDAYGILPLALPATALVTGTGLAVFGGWLILAASKARSRGLSDAWPAKFLAVAGAAFAVGAIHGTVQSLPAVWEWLRGASYGGHLVAHLAYGHILVVGGGTFCLAALTYRALTVTGRPIFSRNLAEISFWFSLVGVSFFYLALLGLGLAEGRLVHQGLTYDQAKETMAGLHKVLLMEAGVILGVGYWTLAANVLLSLVGRRAAEPLREPAFTAADPPTLDVGVPPGGAGTARRSFTFLAASAFVAFLLGTVQGVFQVIPYFADWIKAAGPAGELIDPLAHAHINMVGGVFALLAALSYALLPAAAGRAIPEDRVGRISPFLLIGGAAVFYLTALGLGIWEGRLVAGGLTYSQVENLAAPWHGIALTCAGLVMASGILLYLGNLIRTLLFAPFQPALLVPLPQPMVAAAAPSPAPSRAARRAGVWAAVVISGLLFALFPVTAALIFLSE